MWARGSGDWGRPRGVAPPRWAGHDRLHGEPAARVGGYRVASFQQRGVGPSTLAGPFDVPTLRGDVIDVLDTLGWQAPVMIWSLLGRAPAAPPAGDGAGTGQSYTRRGSPGAVGDGGLAAFEPELFRRLPEATLARLTELERSRRLARSTGRGPRGHGVAWPGYFSSPGRRSRSPSRSCPEQRELGLDPRRATRSRPDLRGCNVPTRFVHGELDPLPVTASTNTAECGRVVEWFRVTATSLGWRIPAAYAAALISYFVRPDEATEHRELGSPRLIHRHCADLAAPLRSPEGTGPEACPPFSHLAALPGDVALRPLGNPR